MTATVTRELKKSPTTALDRLLPAYNLYRRDEEWVENYHLKLNMKMRSAQLRIELKPKFTTLRKIVLVVTCAPSLERCYVFELATSHQMIDWGLFAPNGEEIPIGGIGPAGPRAS